jgi:hypothetical protein
MHLESQPPASICFFLRRWLQGGQPFLNLDQGTPGRSKHTHRDGTTRIYDAKGRYQGRISEKANGDDVIYDAQGKFQGRIKK